MEFSFLALGLSPADGPGRPELTAWRRRGPPIAESIPTNTSGLSLRDAGPVPGCDAEPAAGRPDRCAARLPGLYIASVPKFIEISSPGAPALAAGVALRPSLPSTFCS